MNYTANTVDFHGYTVKEAVEIVDQIIDDCRVLNVSKHYTFITGRGKIATTIKDKLKKEGIEHRTMIGNEGVLLVEIE